MKVTEGKLIGTGLNIAIIASRFNDIVTSRLIDGAKDTLMRHDVSPSAIDIFWVPGAWELPLIAEEVVLTGKYDAVVLTCDTLEQALLRAGSKAGNKGSDCALGAIEMANLLRNVRHMADNNTSGEKTYNA